MNDTRRMLYLPKQVDDAVKQAAEVAGLSVNEWINLALISALSSEPGVFEVIETKTIRKVL